MKSELIITTYNSPDHLDLVLRAIAKQNTRPNQIAIADDGSGPETKSVIDTHSDALPIRHVWHPDTGFAKNEILNKTIASSACEHLIFIDGDCLAAPNFVARHRALAGAGYFATGSVIRLTSAATHNIGADTVDSKAVFGKAFLKPNGALGTVSNRLKASLYAPFIAQTLDRISPVSITWSGGNASTLRSHLLDVNGFDETMRYGGEDKELGARLINAGIKGRFLRYSAPLLHLDHPRSYVDPDIVAANRAKILEARRSKSTWAEQGVSAHL